MKSISATVRNSFGQSGFVRAVAVLAGGTAIGQLITVAVSPALTRLYEPDDIGRLGVFLSFISTAAVVIGLRYDVALVGAENTREALILTMSALIAAVPLSILFALLLYFLIRLSFMDLNVLPTYCAALAIPTLWMTSAFITLRYWHVRVENYSTISRIVILQNTGRSAGQVGLGVLHIGWVGLLVGELTGRFLGIRSLGRSLKNAIGQSLSGANLQAYLTVLHKYSAFPLLSVPSSLINTLAFTLPVILVTGVYGPALAGQFALVQRVLGLPLALVGGSVADVFFGRAATYAREQPTRSFRFFLTTALFLLIVGIVPTLFLILWGDTAFEWIFGRPWSSAGAAAGVMAVPFLAALVVSSLSRVVYVFRGQLSKLIYDVAVVGAIGLAFYIGNRSNLDFLETIKLLAIGETLAYVAYFLILLRIVAKGSYAKQQLGDQQETFP